MTAFNGHYAGRRVFLTGHTGFKGAWLALWLNALGAEVTGYSLEPPSEPSLFEALGLEQRIRHVHGDITDQAALRRAMAEAEPDMVFHLAAQALVLPSYEQPLETLAINVMGTAQVLEAVRHTQSVSAALLISSDKCYENREQVWGYRENDALGGHDPYSASKGAMEIICAAWDRSFFRTAGRPAMATARAGNVVGGGDFGANRILPDCIRAAMAGQVLEVRSPDAVRPWQFVLEPLAGYLWLAALLDRDPDRYRGGWNFGPQANTFPVRHLVDGFLAQLGRGEWKDVSDRQATPHEAAILRLCTDKAQAKLGWRSVLDMDQTVAMTAAGYKPFLDGRPEDAAAVCLEQIKTFTALAADQGLAWAQDTGAAS